MGKFLGRFSTQDTGRYVDPPGSSLLLQRYPSYLSYVRANAARPPMLMFTNADGFLYAVSADKGALLWGWSSRNLLAKMQDYTGFQANSGASDGNFAVVDAMNASGVWGSYLVGSFQGGAEHYSFKLDTNGKPANMVFDTVVSGGTVAGDVKGTTTGSTPLRQQPVVAYINNSAFMVYVITVGTTSTLYETNVATGATTSSALSFQVSSALSLDTANNRVWLGASTGSLWNLTLSSGTASIDAASVLRTGTLVNPATGATLTNPLYVGYAEVAGLPHFYALSATVLEVFYVTSTGWTPLWGATTSASYKYAAANSTWSTASGGATLTAGAVVSDFPVAVGSALLVPVYVAGTGCNTGTGWYDFFGLDSGAFPTDPVMTQNGQRVTADYSVGLGPAFSPSVAFTLNGIVLNGGSQGCTGNCQPPGTNVNATYPINAFSWRQH